MDTADQETLCMYV